MKRILITGKNSYIGTSFENWLQPFSDEYLVDTIDLRNDSWQKYDFSNYDTVLHLAAIVHVKQTDEQLYYKVNRDLAVQVAQKAKEAGIKQFIFLSTMSIFGKEEGIISAMTKPNPVNAYGKSKLEAEKKIQGLENSSFTVTILRPPMIYGPNAVGNYSRISKLANRTKLFPKTNNKRSMLYIENLHSFIKLLIDNRISGILHPQNEDYVNTSDLVKQIGNTHKKTIYLVKGCNNLIILLGKKISIIRKVFGTLIYDTSMTGFPGSKYQGMQLEYQEKTFIQSIQESES